MATMLASYEVIDNTIYVETLYSEDIVSQCRKWCGKFKETTINGITQKRWVLPISRLPEIQNLIGIDINNQVEVEISKGDWEGYGQIRVGWHVIASRRFRDYSATVFADLTAGVIPPSGGSAKHPAVNPSPDAKFRLWVPLDFAEKRGLKVLSNNTIGQPEPK